MSLSTQIKYVFSIRGLILESLGISLLIAFIACIIGFVIGVVLSMIKIAPKNNVVLKILDKIVDVYVAVIRGTPMMVQLLIMYGFILVSFKTAPTNLIVPILAFGINSGAYMTEIIRSGINSVDKGQMEAGRSLGMGWIRTMFTIVIPQAIKVVVPTIFNEIIILIKETSVMSCIPLFLNTKQIYDPITLITQKTVKTAPAYYLTMIFTIAICYLVIVLFLTLIQKLIEARFKKNER